ncbi:MAG: hypothetical protein HQK55_13260 [Deltaproteobacteria bacterium]|nr:hypothetical protein [Deltaproteobacteria bacterium]
MPRILLAMTALVVVGLMACSPPRPTGVIPPPAPPRAEVPEKSEWPEEKATGQTDRNKDVQETTDRFRQAYVSAGRPRLAVYLNRQLSDDVEEWDTSDRQVTSQKSVTSGQAPGKPTSGTDQAGTTSETTTYTQTYKGLGSHRAGPDEAWIWGFEDGFLEPFLAAGAQVVDRTVMLRQAAAQSSSSGGAGPVSVKTMEMEALRNKADLFVELLVTRSPDSAYGYEFKASAKDINTGLLKANVSSLRWPAQSATTQVAVPGPKGYDFVEKKANLPPVPQVASWLAADMMRGLMSAWNPPQTNTDPAQSPTAPATKP